MNIDLKDLPETTIKRLPLEESIISESGISDDTHCEERSSKRLKLQDGQFESATSSAIRTESESSQVDVGENEQANNNSHSNNTIHDHDFNDDYNEESDEDWDAGSDNNSDSSDGGSITYEFMGPSTITTLDNNQSDIEPLWTSYTEEESEALQEEARQMGLMKFLEKYVRDQEIPPLKLMEAFNVVLHPQAALMAPEIHQFALLRNVITRYLRKRRRLEHVNTLDDVVELLAKANNVMIVTGAGVSVSCGIPDFRSETGIYSRLQEYELDDPQQMFDIKYFRDSPDIFYSFAKELYPSNYEPSPSHIFVKLMEEKGKLLRNYTQNIDTLEHKAQIKRIVNCHGSFATASCVTCGYKCEGKEIEKYIFEQKVPPCPKCAVDRVTPKNDSSDDEDDYQRGVSVMKPDITFFGESLPAEFDRLLALDTDNVDLLIVMGSSLKVSPVSEIMTQIPHSVPQVVINRTPITHMTFDVQLLGDCDVIVPELCRLLGWDLRHHKLPGGSALSEESRRQGLDGVDGDSSAQKIWKFHRNGVYTFPGAVVSECFLEGEIR
ncbi:DHS-like NAD/FAD-binding domain-containing protein [Phascolomyces articulosus]|uniref:DHS-like NAD/FAD-binding domain-containing protein n=1 Tax=Phascolomyces articulosus TaxID=60185 RepID=A0AAD5P800_9FUNG|nr:DHS-like NAD/FAD-binding domain-containing protein [Phascolomyces articulosus]